MVSKDPKTGKYYMAADEMANHCGLGTWGVSKCSRSLCVFLRSLKDAAAQTLAA